MNGIEGHDTIIFLENSNACAGAEVMSCGRLFQRGYQPLETHDLRQWKAVYTGSLAMTITTNRDSGDWNW